MSTVETDCRVSGCQSTLRDGLGLSYGRWFGLTGVWCGRHTDELDSLTHDIAYLCEGIKSYNLVMSCYWDDERGPYQDRVRLFGARLDRAFARVDELLGARPWEISEKGELVQDGSHI